jgi:hypothetical protein
LETVGAVDLAERGVKWAVFEVAGVEAGVNISKIVWIERNNR